MRAALAGLCFLFGCGSPETTVPTVGLLAPRPLQPIVDPAVGQWEAELGVRVYVGYDTPDRLQRQADGGTRADLFIAADRRWMDALQADGHITVDDRYSLALDPLVFVARSPQPPTRDPVELVDAARTGARIGMLSLDLPEGVVTQQALKETQVWSHVEPAVEYFATSAALRGALETGEVQLGLCRSSSVMAAYDLLATHPFSQDQRYGSIVEIAALQRSEDPLSREAQDLLGWLTSGQGARQRWQQAGLVVSIQRPERQAAEAERTGRRDPAPHVPPPAAHSVPTAPPAPGSPIQPTAPPPRPTPAGPRPQPPAQASGSPAR